MGLFSKRSAETRVVEDCFECCMIGSGAMFSLSGYMLWQSHSLRKSAELSQIRFLRVLSVSFAAAGVVRVLAYADPPWVQQFRAYMDPPT